MAPSLFIPEFRASDFHALVKREPRAALTRGNITAVSIILLSSNCVSGQKQPSSRTVQVTVAGSPSPKVMDVNLFGIFLS